MTSIDVITRNLLDVFLLGGKLWKRFMFILF